MAGPALPGMTKSKAKLTARIEAQRRKKQKGRAAVGKAKRAGKRTSARKGKSSGGRSDG